MKKWTALLLAFGIVLAFSGCGLNNFLNLVAGPKKEQKVVSLDFEKTVDEFIQELEQRPELQSIPNIFESKVVKKTLEEDGFPLREYRYRDENKFSFFLYENTETEKVYAVALEKPSELEAGVADKVEESYLAYSKALAGMLTTLKSDYMKNLLLETGAVVDDISKTYEFGKQTVHVDNQYWIFQVNPDKMTSITVKVVAETEPFQVPLGYSERYAEALPFPDGEIE